MTLTSNKSKEKHKTNFVLFTIESWVASQDKL